MNDWEKTKCILCGQPTVSDKFMDARGRKYDCENCTPFGIRGILLDRIRKFMSKSDKMKISEYVKTLTIEEGKFKELTKNDIDQALESIK